MLLIDGIDEASSHSKAIENFVRACVEAGVRCIATSRPEGIANRSAYQSSEGWDELHLPELTTDQQRQLVKNVVEVKSKGKAGAAIFFDNLFNFTTSRKQYDTDYMRLNEEDRAFFESKVLPIQTETSFQVGKDGITIDRGLRREDLIKMFDLVKAISDGLGEDEGKEKDKVAQLEMLSSASAFSLQFGEIGARVFELFEIAQVANKVLATVLKDVCSEALPPNKVFAVRDQAAFSIVFGEGLKWFERRAGMLSLYEGVDRRIKDFLQKPVLILCDLKGIKRVLEKAIQDYSEEGDEEGGLRKVLDINRASIICDTPEEIGQILDALENNSRVKIARYKNFFREIEMDATHFRRMAVNLVIQVPVGGKHIPHVVELQIHLRDIFQFKKDNKEFMHRPHEYFREAGKKEVVMPKLKLQMDVMTEIAETPVLLALFCSATNFDGTKRPTLPSSRHELYQWALVARLHDEDLMELYQAISFENFANDKSWNQRQFTIDDVAKARAKWQVGCEFPDYSRGTSMPLIKVLDASTGLFQFSHLSIQEAFAGFHAKDFFIDAKHVLHRGALNFVRTCERGSLKVKFEASIEKQSYGLQITGEWLQHFELVASAVSPSSLSSLQKLELGSCNLTGWSTCCQLFRSS